jgi:formylmethanofuran dehydrogenase subunit E
MLRGFLKIVVLKALCEGPKSGYALMKYVEEKVGSKPSSGSMYPLLETLTKDHLIEGKGVGRTKEYKLTIEGKHKLESIEEKRNECLDSMLEGMKMMTALTGEDMHFPMAMIESVKRGELPFKEVNPEWDNLRNQMFVMWKSGALKQKSSKVKKILLHSFKELKLA